jgi:hypothetical protein
MKVTMGKRIGLAIIAASFLAFGATECRAVIITVQVTGIVDSVQTGGALALDGSIQIGSTMKGYALYDSEASDRDPYPSKGDYPVSLIWMEIGSYVFYDGPMASDSSFYVVTYYPEPGVRYHVYSLEGKFDGIVYLNGIEKRYEDLIWQWDNPISSNLKMMYLSNDTLVVDDSLPQSIPDIGVFESNRQFYARFDCVGPGDIGTFDIFGQVTSVRIIPEPATVLMLFLGGVGILRRKK